MSLNEYEVMDKMTNVFRDPGVLALGAPTTASLIC